MSLIAELKRRNVFRVGVAYVIVAWLLIQVAETLFPLFGFGDSPARLVVIALALGFIPVLILAWVIGLTPESSRKESDGEKSASGIGTVSRRLNFVIMTMLAFALVYFAYDKFVFGPGREAQNLSGTMAAIAEVTSLAGADRHAEAFALASELAATIPDDNLKTELWRTATVEVAISTEPAGAEVQMRAYNTADDQWQYLGQTPIENARIPNGLVRLKIELDGYETIQPAIWSWDQTYKLDPVGALPEGMLRINGELVELSLVGVDYLEVTLPDFLMDETEVTNEQFKKFVDAGGYSNPNFWDQPIMMDGSELSFDEAMRLFKDQTGRPGPATWQVGTYPDGKPKHPVGGLSWYEAAAYARFVGKELPTLSHWLIAAYPYAKEFMTPRSNFDDKGTAVAGSFDGISMTGVYDTAGNVREWMWNKVDDMRMLVGGGWSDPEYMFIDANAQSPLYRDPLNGIRLIKRLGSAEPAAAWSPAQRTMVDYTTEQPVSDDIFDVYRRLYDYDPTPLNAEVTAHEETTYWTREKIELDAAYGAERLAAYLYVPRNADPPYTPVVYFPGSDALWLREFQEASDFEFPFIIRSGRAVLYPVYNGTYERPTDIKTDFQNETNEYRNLVIQWSKDLQRSVDYLETRSDIRIDELAFFGLSWGSDIAPIMIATERRIKTAVLVSGGLTLTPTQPEVEPFNFLPRVTVPTRMINVPNDFYYPVEESQLPFFENLGSEQKDHVFLEGGHVPPMNDVARETLDWFETYLGKGSE
jgi:dienelactone hydrolase